MNAMDDFLAISSPDRHYNIGGDDRRPRGIETTNV
jgi:hypothetical protein